MSSYFLDMKYRFWFRFLCCVFWGSIVLNAQLLNLYPVWHRFALLPSLGIPILLFVYFDSVEDKPHVLPIESKLFTIFVVFIGFPGIVLFATFIFAFLLSLIAYPFGLSREVLEFVCPLQ